MHAQGLLWAYRLRNMPADVPIRFRCYSRVHLQCRMFWTEQLWRESGSHFPISVRGLYLWYLIIIVTDSWMDWAYTSQSDFNSHGFSHFDWDCWNSPAISWRTQQYLHKVCVHLTKWLNCWIVLTARLLFNYQHKHTLRMTILYRSCSTDFK